MNSSSTTAAVCRPERKPSAIAMAALAVFLLAQLLAVAGPLRLSEDAIVYVSIADNAREGAGFTYRGSSTRYPPGYPASLALLDWLGAGNAQGYFLANWLCLIAGLAGYYFLLTRCFRFSDNRSLALCCLVSLSFVFVKHTAMPVSELLFFALSSWALFAMSLPRPHWAAVILLIAAISVRIIGVTMIPALVWAMAPALKRRFSAQARAFRLAATAALVFTVLAGSLSMAGSMYFQEAVRSLSKGFSRYPAALVVVHNGSWQLATLGEAALNVPLERVTGVLPVRPLFFMLAGVIAIAIAVYGMWPRSATTAAPAVFLVAYTGFMLAYVGFDSRYWLPVLPVMLGYQLRAIDRLAVPERPRARLFHGAAAAYACWFVLTGCVAVGYSARLAFAGVEFADIYRGGRLRDTYRAAFGAAPAGRSNVNAEALEILKKHDTRFQ